MFIKLSFQKRAAGSLAAALLLLGVAGVDRALAEDAKDSAATATDSVSSSSEWDAYLKGMSDQILAKWVTPAKVGQYKNIKIEMRVRKDGKLANSNLTKSSQIVSIDTASKKAVIKAAPFKPFPEGFKEEFAKFEVNFDKGDIASKRSIVKKIDKNYKPAKEDPDNKQSF